MKLRKIKWPKISIEKSIHYLNPWISKDMEEEIKIIKERVKRVIKWERKNNYTDVCELFSLLRKAFDMNYEAHLSRNRFNEYKKVGDILSKKIEWFQIRKERDRMYNCKIRLLQKAIDLIEEKHIFIEYWLRDDVLLFRYESNIITFHVIWKIECKKTDLVWDWKKHRYFPFKY